MRFFSASLVLFLTACFAGRVSAQVAVVNQKGTRITVDSSKWTLSGSNIINKNAGNVGVGIPVPVYKLDVGGRVRISDSLVAQTIRVLTLIPGSLSDSLLVSDPATGLLKRISPSYLNRPDSTTASNGLTLTGKDVRLGGALSGATSITTTAVNTLAVAGLQGGTTADSLVVASAATGVLKRMAPTQLNRNDSTTASNGLTLTGKDVRLGGALSAATSVTTTAVNTLAVSGLQSGTIADSLVVADAASGVLRRITPAQLSRSDSTTASNGLTLTGKDVRLGGALSGATSITTTAVNTLAIAGLQGGTTADSLVVASAATGVLKRMAPTQLNRNDSTTASNGLTLTGKDVRLGGALSAATSVTTTAVNTLAVSGLQSGTTADSLVVADAASGVLRRITPAQLSRSDSTTASNGLTLTGKDVRLGGALSGATSITTTAVNTLAFAGLQGGTTADSLVVASAATGVLKRMAPTQLNRNDSTTASNGLTLTGKDVRLGGALSAATSVTTTAVNTLAVSGLQSGTIADSLVVADAASGVLRRITPAQLSRSDSTTASNGLTLTGKDVRLGGALSGATSITTTAVNTLAVAGLQGGTTADSLVVASAATGVLKRMAPTQLNRNDSTTASNGLTLTGKDVRLGGALNVATSITTTATNTLAVAGLQGGTTADSIVVANAATGVLKRMAPTQLNRNDSTTASNGLTLSGKDVRLGGTLSGPTVVAASAANTLALTGLSSGAATDSLVAIDPSTGVLKRVTQSLKPVVAKTVTPQTIATTTMTTISGLSFTPQAGKNYRVRVWIIYDAPLLLNGIKLAPSFAGTGNYWYHITVFTAAAASQEMADINGSVGIITSASKGTTGNLAEIEMDLECTTSGLFSFQFAAVSGGTFTIQSNCRISYEITN